MKIVAKMNQALLILCVISFLNACKGVEYSSSSSEQNQDSNNTTITDIDNSVNGNDASENGNDIDCEGNQFNKEPKGFLWKPVSEGDGNLVILFPAEFRRPFLSVTVERVTETSEESESGTTTVVETELESGEFDGFFEDGRQVWRFAAPGGSYTGKVIVDDRSQECVWTIPGEPSERNEN